MIDKIIQESDKNIEQLKVNIVKINQLLNELNDMIYTKEIRLT